MTVNKLGETEGRMWKESSREMSLCVMAEAIAKKGETEEQDLSGGRGHKKVRHLYIPINVGLGPQQIHLKMSLSFLPERFCV